VKNILNSPEKCHHGKSPRGKWNHHLGVNAECWSIHPSRAGPKSRIFQSRLSFIQLTTITERERESALAAFCYFISYTTHTAHTQASRGAKFGHEYQMFVQRGARESIRMAEFLYNSHTQNMYKRGEYYFRHVPEKQKGLCSHCERAFLFGGQRCALCAEREKSMRLAVWNFINV
jgi:hypothetical protein